MKVFNKDKALRQIKLKQNKNTYIKRISIVLSCFILIIGIIMFTFAKFEQNSEEYTLINGVVKYGGSGDIQLSYIVDGVSQSVPPAKGTGYKLKEFNCTNAEGIWDKQLWGLTVYNLTGKAKCNLEFERATEVEVTLYSAAEDEVYYYDNGEKVVLGTTDLTGKLENVALKVDDITIYSSVAKNPDNLSENYSKLVSLDGDEENIYIMPDKTTYWWGWKDNCENVISANGWQELYSNAFTIPTYNTNNINISALNYHYYSYVGSKNPTPGQKVHMIGKSAIGTAWAVQCYGAIEKGATYDFNSKSATIRTVNQITHIMADMETTISYAIAGTANNGNQNDDIFALWIE